MAKAVHRTAAQASDNESYNEEETDRRTNGHLVGNGRDVVKDCVEVGERREGITKPHRPCLAHTARTCSSVANPLRPAADFEAAMAARSSGDSGAGDA